MRIIGGNNKGLSLVSVGQGDKAAHLRPTTDRVRESIFNLLINGGYGDPVAGSRVLDLFAGTGALGLEALSRGAAFSTFVDDGAKAIALVRQNVDRCKMRRQAQIVRQNATRLKPNPDVRHDLVFLDPPYGKNLGEQALLSAVAGHWLAANALVVWEEAGEKPAPVGFSVLDVRKYGDTWVNILEYQGV